VQFKCPAISEVTDIEAGTSALSTKYMTYGRADVDETLQPSPGQECSSLQGSSIFGLWLSDGSPVTVQDFQTEGWVEDIFPSFL